MKKYIISLIALALLSASTLLGNGSDYRLLLKSGFVVPTQNTQQLGNYTPDQADIFEGRYYRYLQFHAIPRQAQREAIEASGIRLLDYIPNKTYIASIPAGFDLTQLNVYGLRAVIEPNAQMKTAPALMEDPLPDWTAIGTEHILVRLFYYSDVSAENARKALSTELITVERAYEYGSYVEVVARRSDLPHLAELPYINYAGFTSGPSTPDDLEGRTLHRNNVIDHEAPGMRKYNGEGISIALGDDGIVGPHIDFTGRIDQTNAVNNGGVQHGDMTAGIAVGAGNLDPTIEGMATGAFIYIYDIGNYEHLTDMPTTKSNGTRISSASYSQNPCGGVYNGDTRTGDQIIRQSPELLHVFSAGNSAGSSSCNYHGVGGYGNITGGYKAGKNVIATGNLDNIDVRDNSSSRGPAEDGRIKPDICSNGRNQLSTDPNNGYSPGGGTSAAAPGIAGIAAQLMHAHKELNGGIEAQSALIKGIMLNSAEDLGNPGPDYDYGWGRVNALRAVRTLEDYRYTDSVATQGDTITHNITIPAGVTKLKVMVYWMDWEGTAGAAKALVNNLDMTVTDPSMTPWNPWVLDPSHSLAAITADATRGVDTLNNMEQVTLDDPAAGTYVVTVTGTEVPQGPQRYYVIYEYETDAIEITHPIGGEGFVPFENELVRWDAPEDTGDFLLEYTDDGGSSWNNITMVSANQLYYSWVVPNTVTGMAKVRVTRNGISDVSDTTFTIIPLVNGASVPTSCPDSFMVSWTALTGATSYTVYKLGAKYMDSVTTTTTTSAMVWHNPTEDQWYSVQPHGPSGIKGRRINAKFKAAGIWNCPIPEDGAVTEVVSPGAGTLIDCHPLGSIPVIVKFTNEGVNSLSSIPVTMQLNGGPVIMDTIAGPVASGADVDHTFSTTIDASTPGSYSLKFTIQVAADGNIYNDTLEHDFESIVGSAVSLPWSEDLETFPNCSIDPDCGTTICALSNGMVNETSGAGDEIDWRTDNAGTFSGQTGPSIDKNPGTTLGKYLYTEASGDCTTATANVITPCFDLTGADSATFTVWYHMNGVEMGSLHFDVMEGVEVDEDVISPINGNQGGVWRQATIDLTAYLNKIINIRLRGITGSGYRSDMAIDDFALTASFGGSSAVFAEGGGTLRVAPNPTTGQIQISGTNWNNGPVQVELLDILGRTVMTSELQSRNGSIGETLQLNVPKGLYYLKLSDEKGQTTKKIGIQ